MIYSILVPKSTTVMYTIQNQHCPFSRKFVFEYFLICIVNLKCENVDIIHFMYIVHQMITAINDSNLHNVLIAEWNEINFTNLNRTIKFTKMFMHKLLNCSSFYRQDRFLKLHNYARIAHEHILGCSLCMYVETIELWSVLITNESSNEIVQSYFQSKS